MMRLYERVSIFTGKSFFELSLAQSLCQLAHGVGLAHVLRCYAFPITACALPLENMSPSNTRAEGAPGLPVLLEREARNRTSLPCYCACGRRSQSQNEEPRAKVWFRRRGSTEETPAVYQVSALLVRSTYSSARRRVHPRTIYKPSLEGVHGGRAKRKSWGIATGKVFSTKKSQGFTHPSSLNHT